MRKPSFIALTLVGLSLAACGGGGGGSSDSGSGSSGGATQASSQMTTTPGAPVAELSALAARPEVQSNFVIERSAVPAVNQWVGVQTSINTALSGASPIDQPASTNLTSATEPLSSTEPDPDISAYAGQAQVVDQGIDIILNGSGFAAGNTVTLTTLRYSWKQLDGPPVALAGDLTTRLMFKTPFVTATTVLTFALTVTAGNVSATDKVAVVVLRDSPWGVAPSAALSYNPENWLPSMAEAGVTTVRGFHAPMAPAQDRFAPIAAAKMSGVGILQWSSSTPFALPANDLDGWRRYVTAQVTRFKGRVTHWEVWNEPPNFTADTSPTSYAKVVAAAFDAAKAVDPTVQIGLAAKSNHVNFLAESIAAGAKDKFDFVTLHPYEVVSMLPKGWEGRFMGIAPGVRKMLALENPAKADVPLWFTELGISAASTAAGGVGPTMQANVLTKAFTMAIAQGVARTYWFDPSDSEGLTLGLTTANGTKRPAWYAMQSLSKHLGKVPRYAGWTQPDDAFYGFIFKTEKNMVLVAWARAGQSAAQSLSSDVISVDPHTGATSTTRAPVITEVPVILVAANGSSQARQWSSEAAASTTKAFPWNGDHSTATSVQLVAGEKPDGLFMLNPPPVTTFNNVPEYDLEGKGAVSFAVDPTFLSYDSTPVRITAVVRGHGHSDPGFNLKYESDAPIASANVNGLVALTNGWFRITGTAFYEKTWVIPNARFIGMYGYNFTFDTDGSAHSQFSIAKVTVSR